ncbi:MAG: hypothetical protein AABZ84_07285 [Pseudomonadota bacterium]
MMLDGIMKRRAHERAIVMMNSDHDANAPIKTTSQVKRIGRGDKTPVHLAKINHYYRVTGRRRFASLARLHHQFGEHRPHAPDWIACKSQL